MPREVEDRGGGGGGFVVARDPKMAPHKILRTGLGDPPPTSIYAVEFSLAALPLPQWTDLLYDGIDPNAKICGFPR